MMRKIFITINFLLFASALIGQQNFDVVIYGATPAGISAAVNAAKEGVSVGLFESSNHIGGLVSGGMSNTDFKTFEALGGTYLEFMDRVVEYYSIKYGANSKQVKNCYHGTWYEPSVALHIFKEMLAAHPGIDILLRHHLEDVDKQLNDARSKLTAVKLKDLTNNNYQWIQAKVFIDATYEGDLMALAGCPYNVGRESRSEYGELYAGVKYFHDKKFLIKSSGAGDHKIQCYNFRLCMTNIPNNMVPIEQPKNYKREDYLPLLAWLKSGEITTVDEGIVRFTEIPNGKVDVNDLMYSPFSLRLVGENYGWPDGSAETRQQIFDRHKSYSLGLFYFLQHDAEVPTTIQQEALQWGLPKDEFEEYGHFPPVLYVREGRRLQGDYVLTEYHTQPDSGSVRAPFCHDAVAICDYSMDSHGNGVEIPFHPGITEGVFNAFVVPYQISYRVMLPPKTDGLLVPVAVSASHVGFSSLRMEPTWTALGQAAGIAATQSISQNKELRDIDIIQLQSKLHAARAITFYSSDVLPDSLYFSAVQYFGSQGFFHYLSEYQNVPHIGRGKKGELPGQWLEAYPYHAISPEENMTNKLADYWLDQVELTSTYPRSDNLTEMSRGEFLNKLFNFIQNLQSDKK